MINLIKFILAIIFVFFAVPIIILGWLFVGTIIFLHEIYKYVVLLGLRL